MSVQNSIMCGARGGEALPTLPRGIRVRQNEGGKKNWASQYRGIMDVFPRYRGLSDFYQQIPGVYRR